MCKLKSPAGQDLLDHLRLKALPALGRTPGFSVACYVTEPAENNFPALPIRADDPVLVWITRSDGTGGTSDGLRIGADLTSEVLPALEGYLDGRPETMRLAPTPRSQLR